MRRAGIARHAALACVVLAGATLTGEALGDRPAPARRTPAPRTAARAPAATPRRATGPTPASRTWHVPTPGKTMPTDAAGRPMLALQTLNHADHLELPARGERGGFAAEDLDHAARVLREPASGNEHPIDPRLLDLVYRIQVHFGAHEIRVVSGYRTPRPGGTSNHGRGRAMDIVVPGTTDEEVARFVREQGFVGCGVYPVSGFVHVDVRERSYFWVDTSGPGKRSRIRGILGDLASRADADAIKRGERPIGPFLLGRDVDAVLAVTAAAAASPAGATEDDDDDGAALPD